MIIDVNAAGLLAQVIPALLVFLALEDRLSPAHIPGKKWRQRLTRWREAAVVLNLIALGLSLAIVVTRSENIIIAIGVAFLLVVLALLFAGMFGREEQPVEQAVEATT